MAPFLIKVGSPILLIGLLIFIHELGHFLVAKAFNVKVLRFSIGFGPRLLGFTKGETEYQLAILPFGGYVKMAGDDPTERPRPEDQGRGFLEQAPWKRSLIALAGPVMNLVFPVLIFFCVYYFQTSAASSLVGHVDPDSAAYAAGLRDGDRIVSIDGKPVRYFEEIKELVSPKWEQPVSLEIEHPDGSTLNTRATPTKVMDPGILHDKPRGLLGVMPNSPAAVVAVAGPDSPAGKAGLQPLDRITSIAGKPVRAFTELEKAVAAQQGPFEVEFLRAEPLATPGAALTAEVAHKTTVTPGAGKDLAERTGLSRPNTLVDNVMPGSPAAAAGLQRGDELLAANGTKLLGWTTFERVRKDAKLTPIDLELRRNGQVLHLKVTQTNVSRENDLGKEQTVLFFGALPMIVDGAPEMIPLHFGVVGSLSRAVQVVPNVIQTVVESFVGLLTQKVAFKTVGGPVMLFDIAAQTAEAGWDSFLQAMAAISVNLGVMNLIPVPVLDGFHVLSAGFEWVRRRPISLRAREVANMIGLAMLLLMMVFVLKNDVIRYWPH